MKTKHGVVRPPSARRRLAALGAALVLSCAAASAAPPHAPTPESEASVVARIYKDYGWQAFASQRDLFGEPLHLQDRRTLERYFTPELARLIVADVACAKRSRGLCHLESDLLFDSQDPQVTDLQVTRTGPGKVAVEYRTPGLKEATRIEFRLAKVRGRWRVADMVSAAQPELPLKAMLEQPL